MSSPKGKCQRCSASFEDERTDAYSCHHGCTFCGECRNGDLNGICPNCGGELTLRDKTRSEIPFKSGRACGLSGASSLEHDG